MEEVKFKFEDLKVYQKSLMFVDDIYKICNGFPKEEKYVLSSQYLRAAISIPLNIAEGSADTDNQFNRFLKIARGSVDECVVCSSIAFMQNYIDEQTNKDTRLKLSELSKMINGLRQSLNRNN